MTRLRSRTWLATGILGLSLVLTTGCKGKMGRYTLKVKPDTSLKGKSIEVHLVGVSSIDYSKWHDYSMTDYWRHEDPLRTTAVERKYAQVMRFGQGLSEMQTLSSKDGVYDEWLARKATHLFVLTNLASSEKDKPGQADFRRAILPLNVKNWESKELKKQGGIEVTITVSGPDLKPQPKEPKK